MCASRTDHRNAIGQLLLASLCWSLGGLLIKEADWPPLAVAGGRGLIAALFRLLTTRPLRTMFVSTGPGYATVRPTGLPSSSARSASLKPRTANFVAL